jgi:hypothetical protein
MKLTFEEAVQKLSEEMRVRLEPRAKDEINLTDEAITTAALYSAGRYIGVLNLSIDGKGDTNYCGYSGTHSLNMHLDANLLVERRGQGVFRADIESLPFLGYVSRRAVNDKDAVTINEHLRDSASFCHIESYKKKNQLA